VASAIVSGQIVATALTAACSERYAEVGVFTEEAFRGRGFATAAASLVVQHVQETGRTPVWSAGEHNAPSLSIAQKLGFIQVSRRTYVILDYD
jgi:predicted GNAT family acetyltransferase